jgi:hypothetical protein
VTEGKNKAAILTEISLILAAIFWGTNYAATKFAALSIPSLSIVALGGCCFLGRRYHQRASEAQENLHREHDAPTTRRR